MSDAAGQDQDSLYQEIWAADQAAFAAYNDRNIGEFAQYLSSDVEFYHDQDGRIVPYDTLVKAFKHLFRPERPTQALRMIDSGSFRVYPIPEYGAVETATHRFYEVSDEEKRFATVAKTFMLWKKVDNRWLLSKIVSYDHRAPTDEERIKEHMRQLNVPMVGVATLTNDSISEFIYTLDTCEDCPEHTSLFNVASMTKPVVTMATLALVENGALSLDQPLQEYYVDPELKQSKYLSQLTVEHVLRHETGFPNWRGSEPLAFSFAPGSQHQYSGEGFEYLRKTLEAKLQTPLEQLVDSVVFRPAGITDAYFTAHEIADTTRVVAAYDTVGTNYYLPLRRAANAADDLLISPGDYARFLRWVAPKVHLDSSPYNQVLESHGLLEEVEDVEVGLGWFLIQGEHNQKVLFHSGGDRGVRSFAILNPNSGKGLVILTSSDQGAKLWQVITNLLGPEFLPYLRKIGFG